MGRRRREGCTRSLYTPTIEGRVVPMGAKYLHLRGDSSSSTEDRSSCRDPSRSSLKRHRARNFAQMHTSLARRAKNESGSGVQIHRYPEEVKEMHLDSERVLSFAAAVASWTQP